MRSFKGVPGSLYFLRTPILVKPLNSCFGTVYYTYTYIAISKCF